MRPPSFRPTAAHLIAFAALFVALGGTSYGQKALTSAQRLITGKQIAKNAITSAKVKDGSLLAKDFKSGEVPAGPRGPAGVQGRQGPQGDRGEPGPNGRSEVWIDGMQYPEPIVSFNPAQQLDVPA